MEQGHFYWEAVSLGMIFGTGNHSAHQFWTISFCFAQISFSSSEEKFRHRVLWHQAQAAIKTLNWKSCGPLWKWTAGPDHWLPTHLFVLCTSSLNIPSWWGVFRTCFNQPVGGKSSLVDNISFSHCTCLGSCLSVGPGEKYSPGSHNVGLSWSFLFWLTSQDASLETPVMSFPLFTLLLHLFFHFYWLKREKGEIFLKHKCWEQTSLLCFNQACFDESYMIC